MIVTLNGKNIDTDTQTRDQLIALLTQLGSDLDAINSQLDRAKFERKYHNKPIDPAWFHRATDARRYKARQIEGIKLVLSQMRQDNAQELGQVFIDVCRELLQPDTFDWLMNEAKDRKADQDKQMVQDKQGDMIWTSSFWNISRQTE